jgi:hypothetical protein
MLSGADRSILTRHSRNQTGLIDDRHGRIQNDLPLNAAIWGANERRTRELRSTRLADRLAQEGAKVVTVEI